MTLRDLNMAEKMPSPTKDPALASSVGSGTIPSLPLPSNLQLHPPLSPGTHRVIRRLQSAHSLGAKAASQPSLISQQRLQQQQLHQQHYEQGQLPPPRQALHHKYSAQQLTSLGPQPRPPSPTRRNVSVNRSPRGRANSDAPFSLSQQFGPAGSAMGKRSALNRRSLAADSMSLDKLLRDGPPNGDIDGALESARYKILDQGIKADSDGMVSPLASFSMCASSSRIGTDLIHAVFAPYLRLVDPAECACSGNRCLPSADTSRRIPCLL